MPGPPRQLSCRRAEPVRRTQAGRATAARPTAPRPTAARQPGQTAAPRTAGQGNASNPSGSPSESVDPGPLGRPPAPDGGEVRTYRRGPTQPGRAPLTPGPRVTERTGR